LQNPLVSKNRHTNLEMTGTPIDADFLRTLFPNKGPEKLQKWLTVLSNNEFETLSDLEALDNDGWKSLGLPLAVTATLKKAVSNSTTSVVEAPAVIPYVDNRPLEQIDCIVMDISGSMRSRSHIDSDKSREDVSKMLFHTLVDRLVGLELSHSVGLVAFGSNVHDIGFTREYEKFHDELGRLHATENATKLYDAIEEAARLLLKTKESFPKDGLAPGCKLRIFVLTDGADNASTEPAWKVARFLQQENIILDAVPLATSNRVLSCMTTATGGLFLKIVDQDQAMNLFDREAVLRVQSREDAPSVATVTSSNTFMGLASQAVERVDVESATPAVVTAKVMDQKQVAKKKSEVQSCGSAAMRRVMKEYGDFSKDPPHCGGFYISSNDITKWKAVLVGRPGTPYEGGTFLLTFDFPNEYPFKPMKVRFVTKIFHPNINSDGHICLDILKDSWSPALSASKVLLSIDSLLGCPNPDDPLVPVISQLYRDDREMFLKRAVEHTRQHASASLDELATIYNLA